MTINNTRRRTNSIIGLVLVGLGALFLAGQIFDFNLWALAWPFLIIIPGALFFVGMVAGGKPAGPLAIPGSIVTMTGLILLFQSITGAWATWAYVWSLIFPTSIGIGLIISGRWSDTPSLVKSGTGWTIAGLIIFLVTGGTLELFFDISGSGVNDVLWPLLLIGIGVWMLRRRTAPSAERAAEGEAIWSRPEPPTVPVPPIERAPAAPPFEPLDPTRGKNG